MDGRPAADLSHAAYVLMSEPRIKVSCRVSQVFCRARCAGPHPRAAEARGEILETRGCRHHHRVGRAIVGEGDRRFSGVARRPVSAPSSRQSRRSTETRLAGIMLNEVSEEKSDGTPYGMDDMAEDPRRRPVPVNRRPHPVPRSVVPDQASFGRLSLVSRLGAPAPCVRGVPEPRSTSWRSGVPAAA
jgi:hypothetical protein